MRPATLSRITGLAAVTAVTFFAPLATAGAVEYPNGGEPPTVNPTEQPRVQSAPAARPSTLPITGTDAAQLAAIGGAAVGVGFVIARRSRRVTPA